MPREARWMRLYRVALYALPPEFRRRHAAELELLVAERLADVGAPAGVHRTIACARRLLIELTDLARVGARLRREARRRARELGGIAANDSDLRGLPMRTALRTLRRRPGFAALACLTLALGVGASTAIFTVVDAILLRPLPHPESRELVMLWRVIPRLGFERAPASYPDYLDFRAEVPAFAGLSAYAGAAGTLETDDDVERLSGARVSGDLFRMLGNRPALGRTIVDGDDRPGAERVIVLADGLWRRRFGADSSILGRTVLVNDAAHTVIGVMPATFVFPSERAQFWTALRLDPTTTERDANFLALVGRLRDDAGLQLAAAQVEAVANRIAAQHPGLNEGYGVRLERRHDFIADPVRPVLLLLAAAVAVLLAIALANLTNLQLVRGAGLRRERAVRRALGASRARLVREGLAESMWIAVFGGLLGIAIAIWLTGAMLRFTPSLPRTTEIAVDERAILFAAAVALLCAVVAATIGVVAELRRRPDDVLAGGSRGATERGVHRAQEGLVVAQLALALMLFVGAGLLARSFQRLIEVPRGFDGERVLTAKLSLPSSRYDAERIHAFYDELLTRLAVLPGAASVSGTWALPFSDDWASSSLVPADRPPPDGDTQVSMSPVRPGFFATIGVPLRAGRDFTPVDGAEALDVAIINETLARLFWPGESAIGKQLRSADPDDDDPPVTIVGVVGDLRRRGLALPVEPEMFVPHAQAGWSGGDLYITIRAQGDPYALAPALRAAVTELDPRLPITNLATLDELVDASVVAPRFRSLLLGGFALLAGLLAMIGVYGVLVFAVAQRRHEIAVRSALGATPARVLSETLERGLRMTLIGALLGLAAAAAGTPLARSLLFEIEPFDLPTYALGVLLTVAVALLGSWLPARRAARIDPMITLREET